MEEWANNRFSSDEEKMQAMGVCGFIKELVEMDFETYEVSDGK